MFNTFLGFIILTSFYVISYCISYTANVYLFFLKIKIFILCYIKFQAYLSLPNSNQVNERLRFNVHVQICVGAKLLLLLRGETTTDLKNMVPFYKNYGMYRIKQNIFLQAGYIFVIKL